MRTDRTETIPIEKVCHRMADGRLLRLDVAVPEIFDFIVVRRIFVDHVPLKGEILDERLAPEPGIPGL